MNAMRSSWLWFALAAGCFSERPTSGACIDGEAACDCRPDATCEPGLECIAAIDKCTPVGCAPGSESCTCVDGGCLTGFACTDGVCVPPTDATSTSASGASTVVTETVGETTAGSNTTPVTDSSTSDPTDPPPDTSATEPMSTVSTDPTQADASVSLSDTARIECPDCVDMSGQDECAAAAEACTQDPSPEGCRALLDCAVYVGNPIEQCCPAAMGAEALVLWENLVACAQATDCAGTCALDCEG